MKGIRHLAATLLCSISMTASAIPSLQLGGDGSSAWSYDNGSDTWIVSGTTSFDLYAYANATSTQGGNGSYAWADEAATDADPSTTDRYAYLAVGSTPDIGNVDAFDITVSGATLITTGYGNPPLEDHNSLAGHGIYGTYFEIYEFQFDDSDVKDISDIQPGGGGTGKGYIETFGIEVLSLLDGVEGIHFDLFTVSGDGRYTPPEPSNKDLVYAFAPFSHDAEWRDVPEPGLPLLIGAGLLLITAVHRRKRNSALAS